MNRHKKPTRRPRLGYRPTLALLEDRSLLSRIPIGPGASPVDVLSYHGNDSRTGTNPNEVALTPATVSSSSFGKLAS